MATVVQCVSQQPSRKQKDLTQVFRDPTKYKKKDHEHRPDCETLQHVFEFEWSPCVHSGKPKVIRGWRILCLFLVRGTALPDDTTAMS